MTVSLRNLWTLRRFSRALWPPPPSRQNWLLPGSDHSCWPLGWNLHVPCRGASKFQSIHHGIDSLPLQCVHYFYNTLQDCSGRQAPLLLILAAIVQLLLSHGAAVDSISGSIYRENQYGEAPINAWEHSVAPGSALYHMRQTRDLHKLRTRLDSLEKLLTKVFDVVSDDCTRRRRRDRGRAHRHSRSRSRSRSECRRGR